MSYGARLAWLFPLAAAVGGCNTSGLPFAAGGNLGDGGSVAGDLAGADLSHPDLAPPRPDLVVLPDLFVPPGYPAPHTPLPQVVTRGGPVMARPEITSVTFNGESLAKDLDGFIATLPASSWWSATTAEFGVGPATARPPVHLQEAAGRNLDDGDIQVWLDDKLDGNHPEFGTPSANSLFVLFYPVTTHVTVQSATSCQQFYGYHSSFVSSQGSPVAYAVVPRCPPDPGLNTEQTLTVTTSHEIAEAVTDPQPGEAPAYLFVDQQSLGWMQVLGGGEVADLCTYEGEWTFQPADLKFTVQRTWSNKAAQLGHDPCVPPPPNLFYFNSAPVLPDSIPISIDDVRSDTPGLKLQAGVPRTIEVDLFSDGPTAPWNVSAMPSPYSDGDFTFTWDRTRGANGDKLQLTVTLTRASSLRNDGFLIESTVGARSRRWPVAVQAR